MYKFLVPFRMHPEVSGGRREPQGVEQAMMFSSCVQRLWRRVARYRR
jgi:hypothetical protein